MIPDHERICENCAHEGTHPYATPCSECLRNPFAQVCEGFRDFWKLRQGEAENEVACLPMETPEQEEHRYIQELCRIKGELGRTGRYGVYFDLTGPEIEFWVEEFGKPDLLRRIKHQDAGTVLDYVRKRCEELHLIEP